MRRKAVKLRQFPLGGAKVNSTCIGTSLLSYFVVGDSHNNIRLYTFENQQEIQVYSNNSNNNVQTEVTAVALSCTEKEIFSGTNRGIINIWDMETAKAHTLLRGHSTSVNCFGVYPEEPSRLASGSYDTMVKLWDIREKNNTLTLKGHTKPINSISISPDGNMLLSGSEDNTARLWELRFPDKPIYIANEHNGPLLKVKFNPEDCMFATCSMDKTAKYFRCEQKYYGFISSTEMVATPVTSIGFSEDGKTMYTAANDVLKSWNMYKNGLLNETFDTNWKGVQDIAIVKGALMGIAFSAGSLSLWVCDIQKKIKNNSQMSEESSFVLPKITRGRFGDDNQINELQNIVGLAIQKVNTIEERPTRDNDKRNEEIQKKKLEMEKRKAELQKRKEEEEIKRIEAEKQRALQRQRLQKQKQEKERKQQQKRKIEEQKLHQKLYKQRMERQKQINQKVKKSLEENVNLEVTIGQDILDNSSIMNISTFVVDGFQKEKLRQMELIGDIMKDSVKYEKILSDRTSQLMPILNYWKQGRINLALQLAQKANHFIKIDFTSTILTTPRFRSGITPDVAIFFTQILGEMLGSQKHATYIYLSMKNLYSIVMMFKEELIKIKSFNPLTRVDISREERLAKYDKLIDEFLGVFRQQRLKKYNQAYKKGERQEKCEIAFELHKNLEEILIKIVPKQQPEPA